MPTPVQKSGSLTTTRVVLYRVPAGSYAVVVGLSLVNTGGSNRVVTIHLRANGDTSPRVLANATLVTGAVAGNDWTLGEERYILGPGGTIEAFQGAGSDVDWNLSALEYTTP